jgi:hypothetical protein
MAPPVQGQGSIERQLAVLLTATPGLRAKLFANPTKQVGRSLPPAKYWDYGVTTNLPGLHHWRLRIERRKLAERVLKEVASEIERHELAATVNTDAVFEEFFAPIVKASQWSFSSVTFLSWATFFAGVGLIGAGVWIALAPPANVNPTVMSSIFGGAGATSALGAVYANVKQGIREATVDVARLRMVLTAFATQLGQLRALAEVPPDKANPKPPDLGQIEKINDAITTVTDAALNQMKPIVDTPSGATNNGASAEQPARPRTPKPTARGNQAPPPPT